ncbi:hypothetical protein AB4Z18_18180 [Leifsonia sp. 2TAF2]|uniref:hypothetical protein n=1 Tax=Leifsonia sp. 2TAF2 TaxID=3233009 RepID=UPI003F9441EA
MRTWNPFRFDTWAASNATPKRRLVGWGVFAVLVASGFLANWYGLALGIAALITYFVLANHWANLDAIKAEEEPDTK